MIISPLSQLSVLGGSGSYLTQSIINASFQFYASDPTSILNKVVATHLPNQVTGAVDFLTVTGTGLNARYRTPDNATYRTADSDNVFWKTDASESTCDGNRLIGYDFPRILVKYLNVSPYTILWIAILKPGVTVTDGMRDAFDLSMWWSNTLSFHGNIKGNRTSQQSAWAAESVITLLTSLSGYWELNETTGNALDSLALHNGTPSNVTQQATGAVFNATTSSISLGNNFNFERTDSFSITFWIKRAHTGGAAPFCFSKSEASGNYRGISAYIGSDSLALSLCSAAGSGITKNYLNIITDTTTFHHCAITYNGSSLASGLLFYLDATLKSLTTAEDDLTTTILTATNFLIGNRNNALGADGTIKKFGIWSGVVLTQSEITDLQTKTYPF